MKFRKSLNFLFYIYLFAVFDQLKQRGEVQCSITQKHTCVTHAQQWKCHLFHGGRLRAAETRQRLLEGGEEGGVLQGSADRLDQVLVLLQVDSDDLRGWPVQTESSPRSHCPTEVKSCCVLQELPSKQVLLEAPGGGAT